MTDLVEQALAARDRVAAGWCQLGYGRTADGTYLGASDPHFATAAAEVCALGAACAVTGAAYSPLAEALNDFAHKRGVVRFGEAVGAWNDAAGRTQAEVIGLWDDFATYLKEQS